MADITYTDKDKTGSGIVTQWRDVDANEVKTKVNTKVDKVTGKQLSVEDYSTAEKAKLAGIATGATVNDTDANLKNRANHTGTQLAATISDFQTQVTANTDNAANTAARHTHANSALLATYDQTNANIADAVTKKHTHSNSTALDAVTGVNTGDQDISGKQDTLVSATNIKTINGSSLLGSGNLTVGEGGGTGDVVGPASAVNNRVVFFDGTTGKLIKDSGLTLSGANTGDQDISGKQDVDADLTAIAGLSPTNDDILQRKSGAWANRTVAQYKTDLTLVKGDVGLGNVDNTSDANKPVSSAQQTALDLKSPLASPVFTGNLTTPTVKITGGSPGLGKVLVSDADGDAVWGYPQEAFSLALSDETTAITTGLKVTWRAPYACTLNAVRLGATTAPTGSTIIVDAKESGTTVFSTKLSIDISEKTSVTAASAAVISDSALADDAELTFIVDQIGSTIAGAGLKVTVYITRT